MLPGVFCLALAVASMAAVPAIGAGSSMKRGAADTALAPLSVSLVEKGDLLAGQKQWGQAADRYETALAVDPRNVRAYLGLAAVAEGQGLPGKAVRHYREALEIDPLNRAALERQGQAYLKRGAVPRAEANLEKLKTICGGPCPEADRLKTAIAAPPAREPALAQARPEPTRP
jgi:tetratricopeptide (TPR) repeat protein